MKQTRTRRSFLADVGRGTLIATLGPAVAVDLGLAPKGFGAEGKTELTFGELEPLVCFLQETPLDQLQSAMAGKLKAGLPLSRLLAAGALANARSFGGEDYIGFHTLMALSPALQMAGLMPEGQGALPVFKVLYRNTARIQEHGGRAGEVLHPVASELSGAPGDLHAAVRAKDRDKAERIFAGLAGQDASAAFNSLLEVVQDNPEVHRTVLPYRAWDLLAVVGQEHATTLLRQSLRYCLNSESSRRPEWDEHAAMLIRLIDEHHLMDKAPGTRKAEDGFVDKLATRIFSGPPADAAGAVAAALAEGFEHAAVGEAISLAANQMVLRDPGRPVAWESPGKAAGSVHGDSVGVHASDSANAWRNLARVSSGRNVPACLILGAWQVARDCGGREDLVKATPLPVSYHAGELKSLADPAALLKKLDDAVRQNMQGRAAAAVHRMGELGLPPEPVFQSLLGFAVSEDGALHAEKYFQTVRDDFSASRPAFRWRHLTGLARVTASEFGRPAPGQEEARRLIILG